MNDPNITVPLFNRIKKYEDCDCEYCKIARGVKNLIIPRGIVAVLHRGEIHFLCVIHAKVYQIIDPGHIKIIRR